MARLVLLRENEGILREIRVLFFCAGGTWQDCRHMIVFHKFLVVFHMGEKKELLYNLYKIFARD